MAIIVNLFEKKQQLSRPNFGSRLTLFRISVASLAQPPLDPQLHFLVARFSGIVTFGTL
jgi:hypothetical protein